MLGRGARRGPAHRRQHGQHGPEAIGEAPKQPAEPRPGSIALMKEFKVCIHFLTLKVEQKLLQGHFPQLTIALHH